MNTEEGNKLIASFMGYRRQNDNDDENDGTSMARYKHWHLGERGHFDDSDLLYHWSWDWLMPVVEKISTIRYPDCGECEPYSDYAYPRTFGMLNNEGKPMVRINANTLHTADTLIEATWMAVVDFIIWNNSLQPKT